MVGICGCVPRGDMVGRTMTGEQQLLDRIIELRVQYEQKAKPYYDELIEMRAHRHSVKSRAVAKAFIDLEVGTILQARQDQQAS